MYLHSVFATGLCKQDLDDFQWNIWWIKDTILMPWISRLDLVDPNKDI